MKKSICFALMTIAGVITAGAEVYEYEPGPFDRVSVRGDFNIIYSSNPDSVGYVRYEADRDFSEKIDITCNKGKLGIVAVATEEDYGALPTLYLYSGYLTSLSSESTGTITADLSTATPTLSLKQIGNGKIVCDGVNCTDLSANIETGNGSIVVRGKCRDAKLTLTGSGVIQADELNADNVNCVALGTGSIGCRPLENLDVRGIGTTKIYYYGNPAVKKVGGAKLEKMPEEGETVVE